MRTGPEDSLTTTSGVLKESMAIMTEKRNNTNKGGGDSEMDMERRGAPDQEAGADLAGALYPELKRLAAGHMRHERPDHTLQATALVNELYLQLLRRPGATWTSRSHFLQAASQAMHRLLVDHARARKSQKRGGDWFRLSLEDTSEPQHGRKSIEVLELDELLSRLSQLEPRMAKVVELRFFGGLTFVEVAEALGIDERTAKRDWALARVWLRGQLGSDEGGGVGAD